MASFMTTEHLVVITARSAGLSETSHHRASRNPDTGGAWPAGQLTRGPAPVTLSADPGFS